MKHMFATDQQQNTNLRYSCFRHEVSLVAFIVQERLYWNDVYVRAHIKRVHKYVYMCMNMSTYVNIFMKHL